jgi:hypothetical protein
MKIKHLSLVIWLSILVAWIFDLLFWKQAPGVSFPILVVLTLTAGYILLRVEGRQVPAASWLLVPPILFFAVMFFVRSESFSQAISFSFTVGLMAILALTCLGGKWWNYSFGDYVVKGLKFCLSIISAGLLTLLGRQKTNGESANGELSVEGSTPAAKPRLGWSILRGLILAIPIVLVLAALLASGDPVFNVHFQEFLKYLDIQKLPEYLFRLFYILILAYLLAGAYLHALSQSQDEHLVGLEKPWLPRFLGWVESVIILGAVDLLFATFILIQINYLFGGQANIHEDGFTYADYARKGFVELLVVAVISLILIQVLSSITKRKNSRESNIFSGLNIALVALVVMILVSAFQRLLLYKAAYGFTRIRVYSETFMIWMAVLLLATALFEFIRRERLFSLAVLACAIGFGVTVNLINVDATIARENVVRAESGNKLDIEYLATLSEDSVPYLADVYSADPAKNSGIGAVLACRNARINPPEDATTPSMPERRWMSYNVSRQTAWNRLDNLDKTLKSAYPLQHDPETQWDYVMYGAERLDCGWFGYWD